MGEENTTQHINAKLFDRIFWSKLNPSKIKVKEQANVASVCEHNILQSLKFCAKSQAFKVEVAKKPLSQK